MTELCCPESVRGNVEQADPDHQREQPPRRPRPREARRRRGAWRIHLVADAAALPNGCQDVRRAWP